MTYKQAYDKIIEAYFKDEIKPLRKSFCFCGTLSPDSNWGHGQTFNKYPYKAYQYERMESALFKGIRETYGQTSILCMDTESKLYEDALFTGMSAALDVLKQIHIERGEIIDEPPVFTKRKLQNV